MLPDGLRVALAAAAGRLGPCATRVRWFPDITSTNDVALALADEPGDEGTLIVADMQTNGRGRLGRSWVSPPGAGVYASVILRPPPHVVPLMTLSAGLAVSEGIEIASGLRTGLKWPNDVYAGQPGAMRKIAGILTEGVPSAGAIAKIVVGFGINVGPAAYPADLTPRISSIGAELGQAVDRDAVLVECLAALWMRYMDLAAGRERAVLADWRRRAGATFGRPIEWDAGPSTVRAGIVDGLDDSGALVVDTPHGRERIVAGEVRWM